jgi:hypothetical protein
VAFTANVLFFVSLFGSHALEAFINPLTPELNPSAQRRLMRFFTGDFDS